MGPSPSSWPASQPGNRTLLLGLVSLGTWFSSSACRSWSSGVVGRSLTPSHVRCPPAHLPEHAAGAYKRRVHTDARRAPPQARAMKWRQTGAECGCGERLERHAQGGAGRARGGYGGLGRVRINAAAARGWSGMLGAARGGLGEGAGARGACGAECGGGERLERHARCGAGRARGSSGGCGGDSGGVGWARAEPGQPAAEGGQRRFWGWWVGIGKK
jgi:hypothetical protein